MNKPTLNRQTIRILSAVDLRAAAGGSDDTSINSGICTTVVSDHCTVP